MVLTMPFLRDGPHCHLLECPGDPQLVCTLLAPPALGQWLALCAVGLREGVSPGKNRTWEGGTHMAGVGPITHSLPLDSERLLFTLAYFWLMKGETVSKKERTGRTSALVFQGTSQI